MTDEEKHAELIRRLRIAFDMPHAAERWVLMRAENTPMVDFIRLRIEFDNIVSVLITETKKRFAWLLPSRGAQKGEGND